jgi:hypothetical protein
MTLVLKNLWISTIRMLDGTFTILSDLNNHGCRINMGKIPVAQVMEFCRERPSDASSDSVRNSVCERSG